MEQVGIKYLVSEEIFRLFAMTERTGNALQNAAFQQSASVIHLAISIHFSGDGAEQMKAYLTCCQEQYLKELMELAAELSDLVNGIYGRFRMLETRDEGRIDQVTLRWLYETLQTGKDSAETLQNETAAVISSCSRYMEPDPVPYTDAAYYMGRASKSLESIEEDLLIADSEGLADTMSLLERIGALKKRVSLTIETFYPEGTWNPSADSPESYDWYVRGNTEAYGRWCEKTEFDIRADEAEVAGAGWAGGLFTNLYGSADVDVLDAAYETEFQKKESFLKAKATVFEAGAAASLFSLAKLNGSYRYIYADADMASCTTKERTGFYVNSEVGVKRAEGSFSFGAREAGYAAEADARLLWAKGRLALQYQGEGQFEAGVKANADLCSASAGTSWKFLTIKYLDEGTGEKVTSDSLFKMNAKALAKIGAAFSVYASSKKICSLNEYSNLNAITLELEGALFLGADMKLTFPMVYTRWPWSVR